MRALYRRYRPTRLEDVVGQEQVIKPLITSLKQGKINHAYLLIGPRGCGKTSVARILAHAVNGFDYEIEDNYVDIVEIDGASNRGIDNIRELREKVAIAPSTGKYKIYIIDEVHMLTKEAFNALLKTLEEPPAHAIFIMATTDAYKVPVTITSRAQTYTFKLADANTMFDYLKSITEKEKIKITDEALRIIVKRGGGSFRDSLSLLDQISTLSEEEITAEMVIQAMGLPEDEKIRMLLTNYQNGEVDATMTTIKDILTSGIKPETLAEEIIATIIDSPTPLLLPLLAKLPEVKAPFAEAKLMVAFYQNNTVARPTAAQAPTRTQVAPKAPEPGLAAPTSSFSWEDFINKIAEKSDAIYSQIIKTDHVYQNGELHIYPHKKIVKNILTRDNNRRLITSVAENVKITIHEIDESPSGAQSDATLMAISDIMGGEVINDGGSNPF